MVRNKLNIQTFSVDFKFKDGKNFDPAKKYKLAVVCSSSKDGDKFSGARVVYFM